MHSIEDVPVLQFVALRNLVVHEDTDPRRVDKLVQGIREDGLLKNPPVVVSIGETGNYIALDGANRIAALARIGVHDVVVQVVDYDQVELSSWNHLLAGVSRRALEEAVQSIAGVRLQQSDLETARRLCRDRAILAYIVYRNGDVQVIEPVRSSQETARLLNQLSSLYGKQATIYRVQTDETGTLSSYYDNVTATIVYPQFRPAEILQLAGGGAKLPAGITRHVIPRRALRINIDLALMSDDRSVEEKNEWLQIWLRRKLLSKEVRYYAESTFLFDE